MRPTDALAHRRMTLDYARPRATRSAIDRDPLNDVFRDLAEITQDCDTYYVSADMTAVAEAAARTMPSQILRRDDLPAERGYLVYDRPIGEIRFSDGPVPVDGFAWLVSGEADIVEHDLDCTHQTSVPCSNCPGETTRCEYYTDAEIPPDEAAGVAKCLHLKCACQWRERSILGRGEQVTIYPLGKVSGVPCLAPLFRTEPPYGTIKWVTGGRPLNDDDGICPTLLATWTLMQQSLSVSQHIPVDRPERRRCSRVGLPQEVLIVRLRRRSVDHDGPEDAEETGVSWSHRWLVGGHWRNQWLPSRAAHRVQWIAGYVKGPASKPLVVKDRVTAWVR